MVDTVAVAVARQRWERAVAVVSSKVVVGVVPTTYPLVRLLPLVVVAISLEG